MNIEDIKADREAGTPGDFHLGKDSVFNISLSDLSDYDVFSDAGVQIACVSGETRQDTNETDAANARRMSRVPQLEEAVIAYDELEIIAQEIVGFKADTHHHDGDDYISMDAASWYAFQNDMEAAIAKIKNAMGDRS